MFTHQILYEPFISIYVAYTTPISFFLISTSDYESSLLYISMKQSVYKHHILWWSKKATRLCCGRERSSGFLFQKL